MKRLQKFTALLIVVLVFIAMVPTAFATEYDSYTEVNETVYATIAVNVRTGPNTNYTRLGTLGYREAIQRIAIGKNGWSKVIYKGETAYICSEYLSVTRPVFNAPDVDYSELTNEITMANGLRRVEYTTESWSAVNDALGKAIDALNSDSQAVVDASRKALEEAIAALVKTEWTTLEESLQIAEDYIAGAEKLDAWFELIAAVNNGKSLLASNDQAAIDEAAARIDALVTAVKATMAAQNSPEIITQEVRVEVPPTDDYCNIPSHRVWPVVFFCSLALNVALVAVIAVYISRKKNQRDDTPLVDYDISDDIF